MNRSTSTHRLNSFVPSLPRTPLHPELGVRFINTHWWCFLNLVIAALMLLAALSARAQSLINVDFGAGNASPKTGFAATGQGTNDYWNLFSFYKPKFTPGTALR